MNTRENKKPLNRHTLKAYHFKGTPRVVGRAHGEELKYKILQHLDLVLERSLKKSNLQKERLLSFTKEFIPHINEYAPAFLDEIHGIAEGAGISTEEALLLQIRQEAIHIQRFGITQMECTTYAVSKPYTKNGVTYASQNADLAGPFENFTVIIKFSIPGKPNIKMLIPAGQISYIGMNDAGVSACANFLNCRGWRAGFPRYLLTRLALEQRSAKEAQKAVLKPYRASSRNILIADDTGYLVDLELAVANQWTAPAVPGCVVHSNHFVSETLKHLEESTPRELKNSELRYSRIQELLESRKGSITMEDLKTFSKDHANYPDSICAHEQNKEDYHTFASLIMDLTQQRMEIALGNPCSNTHRVFDV